MDLFPLLISIPGCCIQRRAVNWISHNKKTKCAVPQRSRKSRKHTVHDPQRGGDHSEQVLIQFLVYVWGLFVASCVAFWGGGGGGFRPIQFGGAAVRRPWRKDVTEDKHQQNVLSNWNHFCCWYLTSVCFPNDTTQWKITLMQKKKKGKWRLCSLNLPWLHCKNNQFNRLKHWFYCLCSIFFGNITIKMIFFVVF